MPLCEGFRGDEDFTILLLLGWVGGQVGQQDHLGDYEQLEEDGQQRTARISKGKRSQVDADELDDGDPGAVAYHPGRRATKRLRTNVSNRGRRDNLDSHNSSARQDSNEDKDFLFRAENNSGKRTQYLHSN